MVCAVAILTLALIPVNLFCVNFPQWVPAALSVVFCGGLAAYLVLFETKLVTKIVLPTLFVIIALFCSVAPATVPYWNSFVFKSYNGVQLNYNEEISFKAAQEDMRALKANLERTHPLFIGGLTTEVENAYNAALDRLRNADKLTVNGLRREIQTVLHLLGDAHTSTYNSYPNDAYLKVIPQKYSQGYDIFAVNGCTVEEIRENAKYLYCYETEDGINIDLGSLATLDFLGISSPFTYEWRNGEEAIVETYSASDYVSWEEFLVIRRNYYSPDQPENFVYYNIDEQKSLAVLTLTQCAYNQTYIDCVREMFVEVKQKNIRNVAVDLRGNGGGSSLVGNEFIKYLPVDSFSDCPYEWRWGFLTLRASGANVKNRRVKELTFYGNVFVLTDKDSFSAARDFAMLIQDNRLGKVVGEPSANAVNCFGEVAYFYLPNTGLFVQISTKKFGRIDSLNKDGYVMPDYPCVSKDCLESLYGIIDR